MSTSTGRGDSPTIVLALDPSDPVVREAPVQWAASQFTEVLAGVGITVVADAQSQAALTVVVGGGAGAAGPAESFSLSRRDGPDGPVHVEGGDARGLMYGVLELADRARFADDPLAELRGTQPTSQQPATPVRSILRTFVSDVEDKPWFHDREFWAEYLDRAGRHRFNRFHLALGMQYNYGADRHGARTTTSASPTRSCSTCAGYDVRAEGVVRGRGTSATSRPCGSSPARRSAAGWTSSWACGTTPTTRADGSIHHYPITGLSPETHAAYCAAALGQLLAECPAIDGLTFRVHYEGGIPDDRPRDVLASRCSSASPRSAGRSRSTCTPRASTRPCSTSSTAGPGSPVCRAKYWAEHVGTAVPPDLDPGPGGGQAKEGRARMNGITEISRRFTRYGYGDFLREEGREVMFRVWPGTQGCCSGATLYSRRATGGSAHSAAPPVSTCANRCTSRAARTAVSRVDATRTPRRPRCLGGREWNKYRYSYLLWGRLLYNPDAEPETWRRHPPLDVRAAAADVEDAL